MRIKVLLVFLITGLFVWFSSCRKDFEYAPSAGNLSFSKDTVYLDTIFSNIGSSTYSLKVYNPTRDDVIIPSVGLRNGPTSAYRLNVDGIAGKTFQNIPLNAQDSLFIFIETTVDISDNNLNTLLYTDAIQFDAGSNIQEVQLVTLVKDAIFLFPETDASGETEMITLDFDAEGNQIQVEGFELSDTELNFTGEKPYVIYGFAVVSEGKELLIDPGARIHFHKDSGLLIKEGATITINGALSENRELLENEVVFEGDRLEPSFSDIPGQWSGIWIARGSISNAISYTTIKNATVGLFIEGDGVLDTPTLTIENSQLYNNASHNIWAETAYIEAQNVVLGSSGSSSLYCSLGGNYSFIHSTIDNYWSNGFRVDAALEINNFIPALDNNANSAHLVKADFKNCIIAGNGFTELSLTSNDENDFNFNFSNCYIKFDDISNSFQTDPLYDFENNSNYESVILEGDLDFFRTNRNDYRIGLDAEVINQGNPIFSAEVPLDILGINRTSNPDLGAYQARDKEED